MLMGKNKTIDLTKLASLPIDEEDSGFRPDWKNTLLMTRYDDHRTFVLDRDGRHLILTQPLHAVLERFAHDNGVAEFERQALYDMIGVRKGRGYIAGHNRLVPTCGTSNANVVYYMAHHLTEKEKTPDGQMVIASFRGRKHRTYRVHIDTSYKTFRHLLEAADKCACHQLNALEWRMHHFGVKTVNKKENVHFYRVCDCYRDLYNAICRERVLWIVRHVISDYCSPEECEEIIKRIERLIKNRKF